MTASRFDFTPFSEAAQASNADITQAAKELEAKIEVLPNSRAKALALTALEESIMWARKALRDVP